MLNKANGDKLEIWKRKVLNRIFEGKKVDEEKKWRDSEIIRRSTHNIMVRSHNKNERSENNQESVGLDKGLGTKEEDGWRSLKRVCGKKWRPNKSILALISFYFTIINGKKITKEKRNTICPHKSRKEHYLVV